MSDRPAVYFSAEFGLHESLPIYSGGLGILAGDHLKTASDLGIPLIGIGLLYHQGYFSQRLNKDGWQEEDYANLDINQLPLQTVTESSGKPLVVRVDTRSGFVQAQVWQLQVGRVRLLLLDSNVEGNSTEDRELTSRLYGGDDRVRIRQELLLGIGGARILQALNTFPGVLHLNEGHSAFAILEEIRRVMDSISPCSRTRFAVHGVYNAYSRFRRPRPILPRSGRRASRHIPREIGTLAR